MSSQIGAISSINALIGKAFQQPKGNFADSLNSRYTVSLLAVSAGLLLSSHFWGEPITCWTPAQFTKSWTDFVERYCYVHGTYFVPLEEQLSFDEEDRQKVPINYYQWVPYVLACQALSFYLPRFIWTMMSKSTGFDLTGAIKYVDRFWHQVRDNESSLEGRVKQFESRAAAYIWDGIRLARRKKGEQMSFHYMFYAVFQAGNAWIQWLWLNSLLQSSTYTFWGPGIVIDLFSGNDWQVTGHFPRITHCDFTRRRPASVQLDTVLCVLTLNIYYEKLMIFLWFWLLFVAIYSTANAVAWCLSLCITSRARSNITRFFFAHGKHGKQERFFKLLGKDGLFVMQQITTNVGDLPASYLTLAMQNVIEDWDEHDNNDDGNMIPKIK
uniref:Innexin n=1 Tax=Strongyloides venezuelensis TaxID=75913 RepID=A0A0K0FBH3_STRVS